MLLRCILVFLVLLLGCDALDPNVPRYVSPEQAAESNFPRGIDMERSYHVISAPRGKLVIFKDFYPRGAPQENLFLGSVLVEWQLFGWQSRSSGGLTNVSELSHPFLYSGMPDQQFDFLVGVAKEASAQRAQIIFADQMIMQDQIDNGLFGFIFPTKQTVYRLNFFDAANQTIQKFQMRDPLASKWVLYNFEQSERAQKECK